MTVSRQGDFKLASWAMLVLTRDSRHPDKRALKN
jgi:hypothetical protein